MISFTRDELLNIWQNTPQNRLPDFDYSDLLLDIVVGGAAALFRRYRTCRQGKQSFVLADLECRCLTSIWWISTLYPTNSFCSPRFLKLCCSLFHRNMDERCHTGQCIKSAVFSADESRLWRRINGEIVRRWDVILHQWEVVYRYNF